MKKPDTDPSKSATEDPGVRKARLPGEEEKPGPPSSPALDQNSQSTEREDRDAVPPGHREQAEEAKEQESQTEENISEELTELEKKIDRYQQASLEAALSIAKINEEKHYRDQGYDSVGAYANDRFGFSRQRWYQLVAYGEVLDELSFKQESTTVDTSLPSNESQTRPLQPHSGDADFLWKAWTKAVEEFGPDPRRTDVEEVVDELTSEDSGSDSSSENDDEDPQEEPDGNDTSAGDASNQGPEEDPRSSLDPDSARGENSDPPSGSDGEPDDAEPEGENSEDPGSEKGSGTNSEGAGQSPSDEEAPGSESSRFNIDHPEVKAAPQPDGRSADQRLITKTAIEELAEMVEQEEAGLPNSSAEHMVASKVWKVLVPSPIGVGGGLPEKSSAEEEPLGATLKPGRLDQLTGLAPGRDGERVLVCPGVDLFSEVVPDGAIEAILSRCRKTDHQPVVFTRHLSRAEGFDLSSLWIGTPAERASLETTEQRLKDAAPDAAVRWLLYDVGAADKENAPSFSDSTDWVVYEPGGGNGVVMTLSEAEALANAAVEVEAGWAFRDAFKTCGASYPAVSSSSS